MALALTLTPATVTVGQTFTAIVTGAAPGELITFTYDAVAPQTATADALGNASVTFTATTSDAVVAAGATSGAATATVTVTAAQNCVVTLSSTPDNPVAGQPVTLTATVTCDGVPVSGATVLFATTSGSLGVGVTTAAGQATVTTSLLPSGSNIVTATVIAATTTCTCIGVSATTTVNVTAAQNCVVTLSSTPDKPVAGQPVTLTATVTCGGVPVSGATVLFATTSGSLGVGVTTAAGQATVTTSLLPSGSNIVTATVIAATTTCTCIGVSATTTVNVTAAQNCVVTLSSTPDKPVAGQPVTLTATVTCGGVPVSGATVLFSSTSGPLGIGVTNASGQATVTTSLLPSGSNIITATVIAATTTCTCIGVSATTTVNVTAAQNCVVTLSSTPDKPVAGQPVTLTATVTCGGAPVLGATVLFSSTSGPLGIGVTNASGQATVTTSLLPSGSNVITATVLTATGACSCAGTSATGIVTVGAATGLTAHPACYRLNVPPLPWAFATATFSASGATPGATVIFHLDGPAGPVVCTAVADASGNASCTATLTIGQVLFASYTATSGGVSSSNTLSICLS